ncbi:MAG TPA: helicase-related protein [Anaerolineales bacterium]|nr:helicase-related protein [Anaerolineales bacterium]
MTDPSSQPTSQSGADLFIVDNSDENWKVANYLREWASISSQFDIATGYFEIGALLAMEGEWQKLNKIRILMGDEVTKRTRQAFEKGLQEITRKLDDSLEATKDEDDFLGGVPAIVEAIRSGKIETRVYRKKKFHAKAYITHSNLKVVGSSALVGSSNFTYPGLHQNVELNVQLRREVDVLQEWYERHWEEAEEVSPDILQTIEKHTREYSPFDVYLRAMVAYFQRHEISVSEWERTESLMYPVLNQYQKEGYHRLMEIARRYRGALLCDGVGLGKTFIGLMVIERLLHERKRIALFVPKAARHDVWEAKLDKYMPKASGEYSNLRIYNHTDLLRGGDFQKKMAEIADEADVIIVDEAHHFRNIASQRARKFYEMTEGKELFLLTATPINNSLYDLMHLIEYFSRRQPDYFREAPLGIHTLRGRFRQMEDALNLLTGKAVSSEVLLDPVAAEEILSKDDLFQALVVQRSRAYVKESLKQEGGGQNVSFPQRRDPQVAGYSLQKTYGKLLDKLIEGFNKDKPLVTLPIYFPVNYRLDKATEVDAFEEGRQKQVVGLVRTLLLKRFESSAVSFRASCEDLLLKLFYFVQLHNPKTAKRWETQHAGLMASIQEHVSQRGLIGDSEEDADEDIIPEEFKKKIETLDSSVYNVAEMVMDCLLDMDQLASYLDELKGFDPAQDDKLQALVTLLKNDPVLSQHKVLIFTEYQTTARYLAEQLKKAGIGPLAQVDSQYNNAGEAVHAFSPYYNDVNSAGLASQGVQEIRVLVATDVLAEGLNLQDAVGIINYDLHWNPVRLMQRIGRVDRRLDPNVEAALIADHPALAAVRGTVYLWNFLPPDEMNAILSLYERVTHKALRISKTFGIEGRKFLTPDDDYAALKEFNQVADGTTTSVESMYLAYQRLAQEHPDLVKQAPLLPRRLFSGKAHPAPGAKAVFFCYRLPAKNADGEWDEQAAFTRWYLYTLANEEIIDDATRIMPLVECLPETPRRTHIERPTLKEIRRRLDGHIATTYLKKVQAPVGEEPSLLAWMELN